MTDIDTSKPKSNIKRIDEDTLALLAEHLTNHYDLCVFCRGYPSSHYAKGYEKQSDPEEIKKHILREERTHVMVCTHDEDVGNIYFARKIENDRSKTIFYDYTDNERMNALFESFKS